MTVRPAVTLKVFDEEYAPLGGGGSATALGTVRAGDWLDALNDYGTGSVAVSDEISDGAGGLIANPDLAKLATDRIVQVLLDGTPAYWWVIEEPDDAKIKPGEEHDQLTKFTGRGPLSILERAPVFPTLPFNLFPVSPNRTLSCFSPEFDITGLGTASVIVDGWDVTDPALTLYAGKPSGFPSLTAGPHVGSKWIGSSTGTQFGDHIGHAFLFKDFVLTDPVYFKIFCAADNRARVFVDGMQVLDIQTTQATTDGLQKCAEYTIYLSAGTHRLGVHLVNCDFDGAEPPNGAGPIFAGNPMAFIADCWTVEQGSGRMLLRLFGTNTSWSIVEFPATVPGFTVGQALNILLDQVQADGLLTFLTRTWTDSLDSNGHAWSTQPTFGLKVGQSLAATVQAWCAAHYCDVDFAPGSPAMNLYISGQLGVDHSATIDYEYLGLLLELDVKKQPPGADCLLVQWAYGQTRVPVSGGTRMGYLSAGDAATLSEAQLLGDAYLDEQSAERVQLTASILCDTGKVPGVNWRVGDLVTVDGNVERVTRLAGKIDDSRGYIPIPTFRDVILTWEERRALVLRRMAQGTLAGQAAFASPLVFPAPRYKSVGANELTFHPLDPVQVAESPDKVLSASTNLFGVKAYCKSGLPAGSDTAFRYLVNGVDVLGGLGLLPAGVDEVLLQVSAGTGPDPAVQWIEGNLDRVALDVTEVGYLLSDFVVDGWHVV